ncbi:hypothetical protein LJR034_003982 [Caballeronia sp. LjRoot34]
MRSFYGPGMMGAALFIVVIGRILLLQDHPVCRRLRVAVFYREER